MRLAIAIATSLLCACTCRVASLAEDPADASGRVVACERLASTREAQLMNLATNLGDVCVSSSDCVAELSPDESCWLIVTRPAARVVRGWRADAQFLKCHAGTPKRTHSKYPWPSCSVDPQPRMECYEGGCHLAMPESWVPWQCPRDWSCVPREESPEGMWWSGWFECDADRSKVCVPPGRDPNTAYPQTDEE